MGGYVKRIAVIKQIKDGFCAGAGQLSGLIKAEKYGDTLSVEASLINFAPLSDGKYVLAITDGETLEIFDCPAWEGESGLNPEKGFAALVCHSRAEISPVASACCGNKGGELFSLKTKVEALGKALRQKQAAENAAAEQAETQIEIKKEESGEQAYCDDKIAEENYYEFDGAENRGDGGETEKAKEDGREGEKNEDDLRPGEEDFYKKIEDEVKRVLRSYPKEQELCRAVQNSEWVKITYKEGKFYVFGVIYGQNAPKYLCYGVPAEGSEPPQSLKNLAVFIPTPSGGYFVSCQSAQSGKAVKVE